MNLYLVYFRMCIVFLSCIYVVLRVSFTPPPCHHAHNSVIKHFYFASLSANHVLSVFLSQNTTALCRFPQWDLPCKCWLRLRVKDTLTHLDLGVLALNLNLNHYFLSFNCWKIADIQAQACRSAIFERNRENVCKPLDILTWF